METIIWCIYIRHESIGLDDDQICGQQGYKGRESICALLIVYPVNVFKTIKSFFHTRCMATIKDFKVDEKKNWMFDYSAIFQSYVTYRDHTKFTSKQAATPIFHWIHVTKIILYDVLILNSTIYANSLFYI